MQETSTKPYLIRALHEWCTDNGYTPHIVVTVDENTVVPVGHVHEGQITLNIGTLATNALTLGNDYIDFQARFNGRTEHIFVPVGAVSAIYARETGAGMGFEVVASTAPATDGTETTQAGSSGPTGVISGEGSDHTPDPNDDSPKPRRFTVVK
ncbi:MAG: ClpXP protease specificity-enhancing factor [Burkholderiaceae bacterium]|nr:ClpXP protease specificity-enhancing factor [Burkholderiaceae bacterium]